MSRFSVAIPTGSRTSLKDTGAAAPLAAQRRSLNILFCTWDYWPTSTGGAEHQARLQAEELVARGHKVTVVCPASENTGSGIVNGVCVSRLPHPRAGGRGRLIYPLSVVAFFVRHRALFDVVHIHLANRQSDLFVFLARALRLPVYLKVACGGSAGEVAERAMSKRVAKWFSLRHATRVQALSDEIRSELCSVGVHASRILEIPNGVRTVVASADRDELRMRMREELGVSPETVVCLFLGRLARHKGIPELLQAWAGIRPSGAVLILAGTQITPDPVGPLPETSGVTYLPHTPDPRPLLAAADVFVYPSYTDGMSNAVLEALAHGLCVVASRSGATGSIIEHGRTGLLFDAEDPSGLGVALRDVICDSGLRARLAERAPEAVARFALPSVVDQIEGVYRELIQ